MTHVVSCEAQIPRAQSLTMEETINGCWPIDIVELKAFEMDVATGGYADSKSNVGAGFHFFLLNNESA